MIKTVLENKDRRLTVEDVSAKLLTVEEHGAGCGSTSATTEKPQAFVATAPKKRFYKKSVVCFYCEKKGHMQRNCLKKKTDEAKGIKSPDCGRRRGGDDGYAPPRAALAYAASAKKGTEDKDKEGTTQLEAWMLDSGATNPMTAGDKGFSVKSKGSGAKVTIPNGHKVSIKGHGQVSMHVGTGNTKARTALSGALLVPSLTDNLFSVRAVDRKDGAVVFTGGSCYIISDGASVQKSGVRKNASLVGKINDAEKYIVKVTPVNESASSAMARAVGEAELWHRRFNHLGISNLKRAMGMVDGFPSSVARAKGMLGTVCEPCATENIVRAPYLWQHSTSTPSPAGDRAVCPVVPSKDPGRKHRNRQRTTGVAGYTPTSTTQHCWSLMFTGWAKGVGASTADLTPYIPSGTPPRTRKKKGSQHRHAPRPTRVTHSRWEWKVVNHASLPRKRSPLGKQGVNPKTLAQDENPGRLGRCNGYPIWVHTSELRY